MKMIRVLLRKLQDMLKEKYPHIPFEFYLSKRKQNVHFGVEKSLFCHERYSKAIIDIQNFIERYDTNNFFLFVKPTLIQTIKWKYDYIIFRGGRNTGHFV